MPAVLLAGAFGQRNVGDDALLAAFRRALPEWTHLVTTRDSAALHAPGAVAVPASSAKAMLRALLVADAVVFAGGTVFKTLPRSTGRRPLGLLASALSLAGTAKLLRRPVALVGVGTGSLATNTSRRTASRLAGLADLLVLRDEESAHRLAGAGGPAPARIGADPAWVLLDLPPSPPAGGDGVLVTVSPFACGSSAARLFAEGLADAVGDLPVLLQSWQPGGPPPGDGQVTDVLESTLRRRGATVRRLPPPVDIADARATMAASARLVVAMRFHSCLAAAAAGVPFLAVAHEPKLAAIARRLDQRAVTPGAGARTVADSVREALSAAPAPTAAVRAEIAAAEAGFELLRLLLRRGGAPTDFTDLSGLRLEPATWRS